MLLLVVLVQLLTFALLQNTERFYVEQQQLLIDPQFTQLDEYWVQDGDGLIKRKGNAISIINQSKGFHAILQTITHDAAGHYNISFDVSLKNIDVLNPGKGGAELFVIYRADTGEYNGRGKRLFSGVGEMSTTSYNQTIYIGNENGSFDFAARVNRASGVFTLSNPVVSSLQENLRYNNIITMLAVLWFFILVGISIVSARFFTRPLLLVLVIMLGIALIGVLLPENLVKSLYGQVATFLPMSVVKTIGGALAGAFGFPQLGSSGAEIGKLGHFLVFLILGAIAGVNYIKLGVLFALSILASFAFFTETVQLLVVGRTSSINDFMIDMAAAILGLGIGIGLYWCCVLGDKLLRR